MIDVCGSCGVAIYWGGQWWLHDSFDLTLDEGHRIVPIKRSTLTSDTARAVDTLSELLRSKSISPEENSGRLFFPIPERMLECHFKDYGCSGVPEWFVIEDIEFVQWLAVCNQHKFSAFS